MRNVDVIAEEICDLFAGFQGAHGRFTLSGKGSKGKVEGRGLTVRGEAPTPGLWEIHLTGAGPGIGVVPLRGDESCLWGAIDVDKYNVDLHKLDRMCREMDIPLTVCRSKSSGAHLYLFLKEPASAEDVQHTLGMWAAQLGHGDAEIFPKQSKRNNPMDVGNWLNMPYFKAENSDRYAVHEGRAIDVDEFLKIAKSRQIVLDLDVLSEKSSGQYDNETFPDGPPCLQRLATLGGFPEGTRNEGMFNVAVYLRKVKDSREWVDSEIQAISLKMCSPSLGLSELMGVVQGVFKRDYEYRCKHAPINVHCNKKVCRQRQYGVGDSGGSGSWPIIEEATLYLGEPPMIAVTVNGVRLPMMELDEFISQNRFRRTLILHVQLYPPALPTPRWDKKVKEAVEGASRVPPEEATDGWSMIKYHMDRFLLQKGRALSIVDVKKGSPYWDEDGKRVYFYGQALFDYLSRMNVKFQKNAVWHWLRQELGGQNEFINIKNKGGFRVWVVPVPLDVDDRQTEESDQIEEF